MPCEIRGEDGVIVCRGRYGLGEFFLLYEQRMKEHVANLFVAAMEYILRGTRRVRSAGVVDR